MILKKLDKDKYLNLLLYRLIAVFNKLKKILEAVIINKIKLIVET